MRGICTTLLALVTILATAPLSADIVTLNRQGVEAYTKKEFVKAVGLFTEVFIQAPGDQTAATNLSTASRSLAAEYAGKGDYDNAATTLRQARSLLPNSSEVKNDLIIVLVNKATVCFNGRDFIGGRNIIAEALQLDDHHPVANRLAGDFAYTLHDLSAASDCWKRALAADPANAYLINRLERVRKEMGIECSYSKTNAYTFDIRFDYHALEDGIGDLRAFLMEAYDQVGQEFDLFPRYPITVLLYGESDFRTVNNVPGFVVGIYDGKIRIPVNFKRFPLSTLRGTIFHEYAHALVHDLAGTSCPLWLNEGIAMRVMNDQLTIDDGALRRALHAGTTLSFEQLDDRNGVWRTTDLFPLAYAQSWMMVEYLFDRWSNNQIKHLMQRLKKGESFAAVLGDAMNRTPRQFEEEWKAYACERMSLAMKR